MGLFSSFGKNKQEASGEDSGYYRAQDDKAATERAKAKRASNAGGGATRGRSKEDPVLPEKKRARRRLVGAIALALAVAVGLPMVLDSEPKPLASDIAIQIPSKDKPAEPLSAASAPNAVAPAPVAAAPAPVPATAAPTPAPAKAPAAHAPSAALDKGEEFIDVPARPPKAADTRSADTHIAKAPEHKPEPKKPEPKEVKPEPKQEHKPEARPEPKKPEPAKAAAPNDDARAMAILEGKPAEAATKFVIQVGAFATQDKVDEVQGKLKAAGIKSYVQKVSTASGERTRVRLGPFSSKDEADKARAKLGKLGLDGSVIPA